MSVTKNVEFIFKCHHCGKEHVDHAKVIADSKDDDTENHHNYFPVGWVASHGDIRLNRLVSVDNGARSFKKDSASFGNDIFCSMECAIDRATYKLDQLREEVRCD